MRVLLNAPNLTAAGPKALALRLLPGLGEAAPDARITALLPDMPEYRALDLGPNVEPVWWKRSATGNDLARMRQLYVDVPRLARERTPDVCLTLGDIAPIGLPCPQVIFLHLALLVYEPAELGDLHAWGRSKRAYLTWHFRRVARTASAIIVQTPVMAERVARFYGVPAARLTCIGQPAAVALEPRSERDLAPATGDQLKLLFLAAYYPHKNHRILPAVVAELRRRGVAHRVRIFVTLDERNDASAQVRKALSTDRDVITNLGTISARDLPGVWAAADALLLPTLVESFGLTYVEALAAGRPILTSDRDFARWMCGDLALYFDPLDAASIADRIEESLAARDRAAALRDEAVVDEAHRRNAAAARLLARLPSDWNGVARAFMDVTRTAAATGRSAAALGVTS